MLAPTGRSIGTAEIGIGAIATGQYGTMDVSSKLFEETKTRDWWKLCLRNMGLLEE